VFCPTVVLCDCIDSVIVIYASRVLQQCSVWLLSVGWLHWWALKEA